MYCSIRKRKRIDVDYDWYERNYIKHMIQAGCIGLYNTRSDSDRYSRQRWFAFVLDAVRIVVDEHRADDFRTSA